MRALLAGRNEWIWEDFEFAIDEFERLWPIGKEQGVTNMTQTREDYCAKCGTYFDGENWNEEPIGDSYADRQQAERQMKASSGLVCPACEAESLCDSEQRFIDAQYDLDHPESASALPTGTARNTAYIQSWLNSCPAVRAWKEIDEETIIFNYDSSIEVLQVPDGVEFLSYESLQSEKLPYRKRTLGKKEI